MRIFVRVYFIILILFLFLLYPLRASAISLSNVKVGKMEEFECSLD